MKMRLVSFISVICLAVIFAGCGNSTSGESKQAATLTSDTGRAVLSFSELEHDFGKVTEGEKVAYIFTFENKGTSDLVVLRATTSCGCTVSKYNNEPIAPGGTGRLEVTFNTSGYDGIQSKTISVHSNATVPVLVLKITADVINNSNN